MKSGLSVAGLISIFFSGTVLFLVACREKGGQVLPYEKQDNLPSQTLYHSEILFTDSGKVTGKLQAVKMDHFEKEHSFTVMPRGVKVWFYNSLREPETFMSANYAMKFDDSDVVDAKGNVVVVNNKGEKLNTEHLTWDRKSDKILSDCFVKITTADEILMGDGLESNADFTRYKILKIRGILKVKE
jgi:LPS export ABC transporter protein LptC